MEGREEEEEEEEEEDREKEEKVIVILEKLSQDSLPFWVSSFPTQRKKKKRSKRRSCRGDRRRRRPLDLAVLNIPLLSTMSSILSCVLLRVVACYTVPVPFVDGIGLAVMS